MTPFVWMFIKNYENLRRYIINNKSGTYLKLSEFTGGMDVQKEKVLQIISGEDMFKKYKFSILQNNLKYIPGTPIAYWIDNNIINAFNNENLDSIGEIRIGLQTGDNDYFLKYWFEVDSNNIKFPSNNGNYQGFKWFPHNKGGNYCKWYGNQEYVVNWENDGYEIKNFKDDKGKLRSRPQNTEFYFKKSITWSRISSSYFGVRFSPEGFIFDTAGPSLFVPDKYYYYIGGFLISKLSTQLLSILNSSLTFQVGNVKTLPIIFEDNKLNEINFLVKDNINISKNNWDCYETSWEFSFHPLRKNGSFLKTNFEEWKKYNNKQIELIKNNEEKLNKIYSEIYNIPINPKISWEEITLNSADYEEDIKSFISYAVGCMFGRYSLDQDGLQFAGGG